MKRITLSVLSLVPLLVVGCWDGVSGPGGDGQGERDTDALSAVIDGQEFTGTVNSTFIVVDYRPSGEVTIVSADGAGRMIRLRLKSIGVGTYPLGVDPDKAAGGIGEVEITDHPSIRTYVTPLDGNAGFITITERTEYRVVGTFEFVANATQPYFEPQTRTVTEGSFHFSMDGGFGAISSYPDSDVSVSTK